MKIHIEAIKSVEEAQAATRIRHEVFGRGGSYRLVDPAATASGAAIHLLARIQPENDPVAALSVVETTYDTDLHSTFGLVFEKHARVARYMQLAVLESYRGLNIPLALILEARARFVGPERFDYTWLLFDATRAASTSLCKWLGFEPSAQVFDSDYGPMRVLLRKEVRARSMASPCSCAAAMASSSAT
jgi:hypothetical protein